METFDVPRLAILLAFLASSACTGPTYFGHSPGEDWGVSVNEGELFFPHGSTLASA